MREDYQDELLYEEGSQGACSEQCVVAHLFQDALSYIEPPTRLDLMSSTCSYSLPHSTRIATRSALILQTIQIPQHWTSLITITSYKNFILTTLSLPMTTQLPFFLHSSPFLCIIVLRTYQLAAPL